MKIKHYLLAAIIAIGIAVVSAYVAVKSFLKAGFDAIFGR